MSPDASPAERKMFTEMPQENRTSNIEHPTLNIERKKDPDLEVP
jgi:hypothetical protein